MVRGNFFPIRNSSKNTVTSNATDFLRYFQVLSAIPKHLRGKASQTSLNKRKFEKDNFIFSLSPTVSINLLKVKSKDFYWLITKKFVTKATGSRK